MPWERWAFRISFACTHPGAEGGLCGAVVHLGARRGEPTMLRVAFSGSHTHATGACAGACGGTGQVACARCIGGGELPLPLPSAGLGAGLAGAAQLQRVRDELSKTNAGGSKSPVSLMAVAASVAKPAELLSRNCSRMGTGPDNWSSVLAAEDVRVLWESGVKHVAPPELGGPKTSWGREAERLVRALAQAAASALI